MRSKDPTETLVPPDLLVEVEAAAELERRGFPMKAEPDGQRVLHYATTEKFAINADGSLDPLVEGSTKAVTSVVHHPGVVTVRRWSFLAPF